MDPSQDAISSAPTTVPRDIEDKLGDFNSQVLLMIFSYVNGNFQDTARSPLMEHLIKLERDSDSYSGIINYTFKRLKVNPALFFTPDRDTVQLPKDQELAKGIELRLALVDFLLSLRDQQTAIKAIKKIAKGSSLLVLRMTPLEIIEEICDTNRNSVEDVVSISILVAKEFHRAGFFDHLRNTDWLHNSDDVNRFLRQESGFSPSEEVRSNYLFMINQVSNSDYIIKDKVIFLRKHPKGVIFCILAPITFLLILLLVGIGIIILLSYHRSISTDQSMEIGDIQSSSALIPVPNDVSSVSLNNPSGVTVFMALSIPPNGTRTLQSGIPQSYGYCAPYNVNNGNHPVYLLPGSIMNYDMTVSGSNSSQCPVQLVLLNNKTEYLTCNYNSPNVVKAYCLTSGPTNISVRINESADYYVILIKKVLTISVSSDITVHQVYYNTSHLSPATDCKQRSNDASCTVHNPDIKKWSCSNTEWYVILQPSSNEDVEYNYKTPSFHYCLLKKGLIITFVICIVLDLLIALMTLIGYCFWTQRRNKRNARSRRNPSFSYNTFNNWTIN